MIGYKPAQGRCMRLGYRVIDHRGMKNMPQQMGVGIESVVVVNVQVSIHEEADSLN